MGIIFVHGFNYDPRAHDNDNPHNYSFPLWREMLDPKMEYDHHYHAWFSVPLTFRNIFRSWVHLRYSRYRWAWDLAYVQGEILAMQLRQVEEPLDIMCHSLGSRVVLRALSLGAPAKRVLLLNGAEYMLKAREVAFYRSDVEFFSVNVAEDDVLNIMGRNAPGFGAAFVGNTTLAPANPSNWTDLTLDDPAFQAEMRDNHNWEGISGDNPHGRGDHWYSFENRANWPLYRAIIARTWPPEERAS